MSSTPSTKLTILIEELDGSLWVAAIDPAKKLQGLEVDPMAEEVRWGSIYWGRVETIDPALDAAFISLDGEQVGLLHNRDVRIKGPDGTFTRGGAVAIGKVLQPGQGVLVQAKAGSLPTKDPRDMRPFEKNPVLTMAVALPGRYLIHTPFDEENRVSVRIRDKKLRAGLQAMVDALDPREGYILRSSAAGVKTDLLIREGKVLRALWQQILPHAAGDTPRLIMLGPDAISRTLSDHSDKYIERIEVVTMTHYDAAAEWCEVYAPDLMTRIKPMELKGAEDDWSLFDHYDIISAIEDLFDPYVVMNDGGSIIIQETAALTAIDINRGADRRPVYALNRDAAFEVARQLRIRNLGGAIVIDFLKMPKETDRKKLIADMQKAVDGDPCTIQIHGFTKLGMLEMTRNRRTPPLQDRFKVAFQAG